MENDVIVEYICDRKACVNCTYPDCSHTKDVRHAENFEAIFVGKRTFFSEKKPEGLPLAFEFLSDSAKNLILNNPQFINQLCQKYDKLLDDSANEMFDKMV